MHSFRQRAWQRILYDNGDSVARDIAERPQGGVAVIGTFVGDVDLGDGTISLGGGVNGFAAKFDANCVLDWAISFGGVDNGNTVNGPARAERIAATVTTGGGAVIAFTGLQDQDLGGGPLTHQGNGDIFVARFDPE